MLQGKDGRQDKSAKRTFRLASVLFAFFLFGWLGGWLATRQGHPTYFEANDISNFFLKNPNQMNRPVKLSEIVDGKWKYVCATDPNVSVRGFLSSVFRDQDWQIVSGRIVDEGLLDYLYKVIFFDDENTGYLMNFDERLFKIRGSLPSCNEPVAFDAIHLTYSEVIVKEDSDGFGETFTEIVFEMSEE